MNQDSQIPTLRVKFNNEQGFCIINKDDFDASKHELFEDSQTPVIDAACAATLADTQQEQPQQDVGIEQDAPQQPAWAK